MKPLRPATTSLAGLATLVLLLAIWGIVALGTRDALRERALDVLLSRIATGSTGTPAVRIVDIDRATLARLGPWPWPRARLAQVLEAVVAARPAVLVLDMLLQSPDRFGQVPGEADGDHRLAAALATVPAVLGFVLDSSHAGQDLPAPPVLFNGPVSLSGIWRAAGLIGPTPVIAAAAQGFGALVASPDADGLIRRVPLLVLTGEVPRGGLAVEAVRLAQHSGLLLIGDDHRLHIGDVTVPLDRSAELRLVPGTEPRWEAHTISAAALLDQPSSGGILTGTIVLIGSSAPEIGGLRATPHSPVTPSVQIQAEAIQTMLHGPALDRPGWLGWAELAGATILGLFGLLLVARLRPLPAVAILATACIAWVGLVAAAVPGLTLLVDPIGPPLVAGGSFLVAVLARFAHDEWRARSLRARFEQHLAPDVVRRIAANPRAVRLLGEPREITALFTDIEDFTALTERADSRELIALLDSYFDAASRVVADHGGMIEKIVGDAVHAIFNAPFELPAHTKQAVACAIKLLEATEQVRRSDRGQQLGLGRTRIGIETGMAVVGDVGGSAKLDYTAHGNVMNTAARLESANKQLGTSLCIGPGAAAHLDATMLRRVGTLTLRGQSQPVDVFTLAAIAPSP